MRQRVTVRTLDKLTVSKNEGGSQHIDLHCPTQRRENDESCAQWTMTDLSNVIASNAQNVRYLRRWLFNNSHAESPDTTHYREIFFFSIPFSSSVCANVIFLLCLQIYMWAQFVYLILSFRHFIFTPDFFLHLSSTFSILCIYWKLLSLLLLVFNLLWHFFSLSGTLDEPATSSDAVHTGLLMHDPAEGRQGYARNRQSMRWTRGTKWKSKICLESLSGKLLSLQCQRFFYDTRN